VAERDYLFGATRDREKVFEREITRNEWIRDHLAPGRRVEDFHVTGDYSYRHKHCAEDGMVLVGDAFTFLDPVFSSGIFLALKSGEQAGDAAHHALSTGDASAAAFVEYGEKLCTGVEAMRRLVYAFYDPNFSFGALIRKYPHLRGPLTDCLIGDLFDKNYDELFAAINEFAEMPEALEHGRAPVAAA
jgi:flavin-dependent dehydrogenase